MYLFVLVFNLVNNEDVEATKRKIEAHKRDNKDLIQHNKFKKVTHHPPCDVLSIDTVIYFRQENFVIGYFLSSSY